MEEQTVWIGSVLTRKQDVQQSLQEPVHFVGEELATSILYADDNGAWERKETLFRADDGRLLVYVQDRSQEQESACSLHEASFPDLGRRGRFAGLGQGWWFLALPEIAEVGEAWGHHAP
jgi:hypothetical protein